MHNHEGVLINAQPLPQKLYGYNSYNGRRGEIHEILMSYAKKIGVDVRFSQIVEDYWESASSGRAGVIVNGERLEADIVVGADGARSRAREIVLVRIILMPFPPPFLSYRICELVLTSRITGSRGQATSLGVCYL